MKKIRKIILNWLLGTDNVKEYMELLADNIEVRKGYIEEIASHRTSLEQSKEYFEDTLKLIKICEQHAIDVDKELKCIDNRKE